MALLPFRVLARIGLWLPACVFSVTGALGGDVVAVPGDAGLRAGIATAQDGDTVIVTGDVDLQSPVRIAKRLTLRHDAGTYGSIHGRFAGPLLEIAADGVVLEKLDIYGSPQTDGLRVEANVVLRDCTLRNLRSPVQQTDIQTSLHHFVRLERVTVTYNENGIEFTNLEAKDSIFSFNKTDGAFAWNATLEGCVFEHNHRDGMSCIRGTVKNCTFRFNGALGLHFDPDPGILFLSGSLFYANAGGGVLLREEAHATVDNCTFTRHTGAPAVIVEEAHDVIFRHCTVIDNVFIDTTEPGAWPPSPYGGAFSIRTAGRVELQNCLVADNPTNGSPHASGLLDPWIDRGGNVIGGPARLRPLANNGGPTLSLLPLPDSPAVDAGRASDVMRDARGLSRLAGAMPDAGAVESGASALADVDADGLPDIWERLHGLNPGVAADASSDTDADGQSALSEFHSRTDPANPKSRLRIEELTLYARHFPEGPSQRSLQFTWNRMPGVMYRVEISSNLSEWHKIIDLSYANSMRDGQLISEFYTMDPPPASFYRVMVEESPFGSP